MPANSGAWQRVIRAARRRLGLGPLRVSLMVREIRARRPDAPQGSARTVLEWYCHGTLPQQKATRAPGRHRHDAFLASYEWRRLRMEVIKERGARCECCGATPRDGRTVINVDHIKPRRTHPELALVKANLQVLCGTCNHGKGNWDRTDWRAESQAPDPVDADGGDALLRWFDRHAGTNEGGQAWAE